MNKGWLWEWRKCESVCLCCVWKGCGFEKGACLHGGHAFECTAHVERKAHLEAKGALPAAAVWLCGRGGVPVF